MKKVTTLFSTAFIAFEITFLISCSDRSSGSYVYPKIGSENNSVLKECTGCIIDISPLLANPCDKVSITASRGKILCIDVRK